MVEISRANCLGSGYNKLVRDGNWQVDLVQGIYDHIESKEI